jgi:hypothetical protein
VQDALGRRAQLLVGHRTIRRAEENRSLGQLSDARTGAERLIVDFDVRAQFVEFSEPFRVDRIGERRARAVDLHGGSGARARNRSDGCAREPSAVSANRFSHCPISDDYRTSSLPGRGCGVNSRFRGRRRRADEPGCFRSNVATATRTHRMRLSTRADPVRYHRVTGRSRSRYSRPLACVFVFIRFPVPR